MASVSEFDLSNKKPPHWGGFGLLFLSVILYWLGISGYSSQRNPVHSRRHQRDFSADISFNRRAVKYANRRPAVHIGRCCRNYPPICRISAQIRRTSMDDGYLHRFRRPMFGWAFAATCGLDHSRSYLHLGSMYRH
jgi:hypothetical protein